MLKATVNGLQLAYARQGYGIPLVLIHGHPLDHSIWEPVVPLLENDFDLILPDLRGFGGSEAPGTPYRIADMAEDIAALLASLHIAQAAIAGHSMGGYVALAFAQAYPERVHGLALVASHVFPDAPEKKPVRYADAAAVEAQGVGIMAEGFPAKLTADPALQPVIRDIILRQSVRGVAESLRAMAERADMSTLLAGAKYPVLAIHGAADTLIPASRARDGKALAENIQLVEIEGVGHMPMMESPQKTAEALKMLK